jgi:hypothetical protein
MKITSLPRNDYRNFLLNKERVEQFQQSVSKLFNFEEDKKTLKNHYEEFFRKKK